MNKNIIITLVIVILQLGCSSNKSGTQQVELKEVQLTLPDGSIQSLKYSLAQTPEQVSFKMQISGNECAYYAVDFAKENIEPTYNREKTIEQLGDVVVKSSYFKDEMYDSKFVFSNHHYRYVYFVANESIKKDCVFGAAKNQVSISNEQLNSKVSTLPTLAQEMNLESELAEAMVGSANYLTYYISVKIGTDDNFRVILRSDDLSIAGLAVHMPILGYKDIRKSYLNRYQDAWDAPEAMPLPLIGKDAVRAVKKDQFVFQLTGLLGTLRDSYSSEYLVSLVRDKSKEFGGK